MNLELGIEMITPKTTKIAGYKKCTKCGEVKAADEFYTKRSKCKACLSKARAAYYAAHREEVMAYGRDYEAAHREDRRAYNRAYKAAHREELKAYDRDYYAAHREGLKAYGRAYKAAHQEEIKAYGRAYYAAHREERKAYDRANRAGEIVTRNSRMFFQTISIPSKLNTRTRQ